VSDYRCILIEDRIYCTPWYRAWLHFTVNCYTHAHTHTSVQSYVFTSRCSVAAPNGERSRCFGFPNYPTPQLPASDSNSSQRLNLSSSLTNSPTNQLNSLTLINCSTYIGMDRTENTVPLLLFMVRCRSTGHCVCLFRGRCLATGLHATCWKRQDRVHTQFRCICKQAVMKGQMRKRHKPEPLPTETLQDKQVTKLVTHKSYARNLASQFATGKKHVCRFKFL
jgi:hypothetical protein